MWTQTKPTGSGDKTENDWHRAENEGYFILSLLLFFKLDNNKTKIERNY